MLNENARKWVAALRSGKYEQQREARLCVAGQYCCLGVACEVYIDAGHVLQKTTSGKAEAVCYAGELAGIPDAVARWLGINITDGGLGYYRDEFGNPRALASDNDDDKTFSEIADIIESEPDGLFVTQEAGAV